MSAHCQLENIPALKFLACPPDSDSAGKSPDCGDASCCPAEKAQYKTQQNRTAIPSSELLLLLPVALTDVAATHDEVSSAALTAAPPEFPKCWQFAFRAALPVRAPSLAS